MIVFVILIKKNMMDKLVVEDIFKGFFGGFLRVWGYLIIELICFLFMYFRY